MSVAAPLWRTVARSLRMISVVGFLMRAVDSSISSDSQKPVADSMRTPAGPLICSAYWQQTLPLGCSVTSYSGISVADSVTSAESEKFAVKPADSP